jgi:heavy metal translocating P-type ATPase
VKQFWRFVRHYYQFGLTIVIGSLALVLVFLLHQPLAAQILVSSFVIFISLFLLIDMIRTLRSGKYGVDILAITAIIATVAIGQFWASLIIVLMLTGGETLEDFAAHRARRELSELLRRAPQVAHLVNQGKVVDVKITAVQAGDIILVKPYEIVPVDGILLSRNAQFDESSLTGEPLPVEKLRHESVMSGSVAGDLVVKIRATADAAHSQYEKIIALVRQADKQPAPFVRLADRYALPFTLLSYLIAIAAWAISGQAARFAEVLVVASPCPLILAAPIALISGMSRASRHGMIVKSGAVLEKLAAVNIIAFDKTGTLTNGAVIVSQVRAATGFSRQRVVSLAASAEINSSHVLANSIVDYAKRQRAKLYPSHNVREIAGDGIFATIDQQKIIVGRADFLKRNKVKAFNLKDDQTEPTAIFVAVNGHFAGSIYFADQLRRESKATLAALKRLGVQKTIVLTGDGQATANLVARAVGADKVYAQLLPADKVNIMRQICGRRNSVAFVGDGVNDAPVLAASDVGIAMGARGSTAASQSADVVIMLDDLSRVVLIRQIAQRTIKIALQSVWFGIALCLILELIAAAGFIPALFGAGLQEVIDVAVIFNALRAHHGSKQENHWPIRTKTVNLVAA